MVMRKQLASRLVLVMPLYLVMLHDEESQVSKIRKDNPQRSFYVLEQLHVLPNVTYLAKVRNTDEIIEARGHHGAEERHEGAAVPAAEHKKEEAGH